MYKTFVIGSRFFLPPADFSDDLAELFYQELATLLSCSFCLVQADLLGRPVRTIPLSWLNGCPAMFLPVIFDRPVLSVISMLVCQVHLSKLTCLRGPVSDVLSWRFSHDCPATVALSQLSCLSYPVLLRSCHHVISPVQAV